MIYNAVTKAQRSNSEPNYWLQMVRGSQCFVNGLRVKNSEMKTVFLCVFVLFCFFPLRLSLCVILNQGAGLVHKRQQPTRSLGLGKSRGALPDFAPRMSPCLLQKG